jgi:adenine-specific DNA-methyltransferase
MAKSKKQPKEKEISIKLEPPKGRPMLHWFGKKPLNSIKSFPSQLVETFNPDGVANIISNPTFNELEKNWHNLLFHGDNKEVLGYLLNNGFRGKVDLIYIDPPFDSGADYIRKIELRGNLNEKRIEGEDLDLGEQLQYHDIWNNDGYLQYLYERLLLLRELLHEKGSLFVHCDWHRSHSIRFLLEEIFGADNFLNEIIWKRKQATSYASKKFGIANDTILWISKGTKFIFNPEYSLEDENTQRYIKERYTFKNKEGRIYKLDNLGNPEYRPNLIYEYKGCKPPSNGWAVSLERMKEMDAEDKLEFPKSKDGRLMRRQYLDEYEGQLVQNLWLDIPIVNSQAIERMDYPTQKPEALLNRIIKSSTNQDALILDCFVGCGTTLASAQKLGRRWIGCDINKGAIQLSSKRLQAITNEQFELNNKELFKDSSLLKYFSFANYKVNDFDLQILRTEAIELAIEHLGIVRTKKDNFFEGMLGKKLVKIIDFNHPLSLHDLQTIQDELRKRPNEDRNITVVCLGKEIQVDSWVSDYNKLHPINKIDVIELRTDSKYGKFFTHKPCKAKVDIKRKNSEAIIEIKEFLSPTILERLQIDANLFNVKIPDFRSMIDIVLIDTNYNGEVFNIVLSDVPEKKNDLVLCTYKAKIPKAKITIAVKIIDMLGEELLITRLI